MQRHMYPRKSLFGKAALATVALGGLLFLVGAPKAQAADRDDRDGRDRRTEYRVQPDYDRGYYRSPASAWEHERYERQERFHGRDDRHRDGIRYQHRYDRDHD